MDGIDFITGNGYYIFYINYISDEFKERLRTYLAEICHGADLTEQANYIFYSYKNTVNSFLNRYETKSENQKKGQIGELLIHFLIRVFLNNFKVNSPFFNMEEDSAKKGFDLILSDSERNEIWITEVKSGEIDIRQSVDDKILQLINRAREDLENRLSENNETLWMNAVNSARNAISRTRIEKGLIVSILADIANQTVSSNVNCEDFNVMLATNDFHDVTQRFSEETVSTTYGRMNSQNIFRNLFIIGAQESSYQEIESFLRSERETV